MTHKKCAFCNATAKGSADSLIDDGWAWAVVYAPTRKTLTACPKHHKEMDAALIEAIGKGQKK
jgi:hypothetical protein